MRAIALKFQYGLRVIDSRWGFLWVREAVRLCRHESLEASHDDDICAFERRGVA
jgi:hypothetical protein